MVTRARFRESDEAYGSTARAEGAEPRGRLAHVPWAELRKAWRAVGKRIPELRADLSCYASVQADRARLAASQVVTRVASGILLVLVLAAALGTAAALVIVGVAGGVASALHGNVWLANLITGTAAFFLLCCAIAIRGRLERGQRMRRLRRRYERPGARQRSMARSGAPEARSHAGRS